MRYGPESRSAAVRKIAALSSQGVAAHSFAAFWDAGNVWTLKDYLDQPNGAISKNFYKEIAMAWGLGLRLVADFVVLRVDYGIKAYDPASAEWLLTKPFGHDKRTFHFAVGYPF